MCGRFSSVTIAEVADILDEVQRRVDARDEAWGIDAADLQAIDARPGTETAALLPGGNALEIAELVWGIPAGWDASKLLFNTRIEKAAGATGMWPPIAGRSRCLVPATGFFERSREGRQVAFEDASGELVLMAGVHEGGRLSIVTTEPASEVARFHDRMPLCLTPLTAALWLSPAWRETAYGTLAALAAKEPAAPAQMSLF